MWIASWHANVLLIKLGVPLSARKELPDNLGPQNDSQMNDNREGTVDFWGCWGALRCCIGVCVRPSVRPARPAFAIRVFQTRIVAVRCE